MVGDRETASEIISTKILHCSTIKDINGNLVFSLDNNSINIGDNKNIDMSTSTGTKVPTTSSMKMGFWGATPVVQQSAVADSSDAASVILRLNELLARMRTVGLIAT